MTLSLLSGVRMCPLQNSGVADVTVLRDEDFKRESGLEGSCLMNRFRGLLEGARQKEFSLSAVSGNLPLPTFRKQPSQVTKYQRVDLGLPA